MKVYLSTLGCKLNESEIEAWTRRFVSDGYQIVDSPTEADICVLNTCTVTHVAARKSRQMARQLARANPSARLVLTGCYASIEPEQAGALPNVALVVPNADKDRLVQLAGGLRDDVLFQNTETGCRLPEAVTGQLATPNYQTPSLQSPTSNLPSPISNLRTRAFVKIQDGCNMSCTYCIIPLARGKERSRPLDEIVAEAKSLVDAGYKEIILTGVQISEYHQNVTPALAGGARVASEAKQSPYRSSGIASSQTALLAMTRGRAHGLRDLVTAILSQTDVPRLRLTSIAPWDLDESLLDLFTDPRLCRHIHLSLQSGCDTVLRRMRRPYTTAQFARIAGLARERIPNVGITTDVIVGFPGESDVEFEQSLEFVERMQFSRVHLFPYSARVGTVAANLPLHVSDAVKESRMKQMQAVADASARAFARKFVGRTMPVLWETHQDEAMRTNDRHSSSVHRHWSGYTDNYIRVSAVSEKDLHNQISAVLLANITDDGIYGSIPV